MKDRTRALLIKDNGREEKILGRMGDFRFQIARTIRK